MHKCINNTIGNVYHLEQMVDNFFPYSQQQLGFDQPVTIVFQSDDENALKMLGKTAYYDPENMQVVLYTDNRHPKDVMRSLSHELVHHAQNCRGDFTSADSTYEGYAQADPHLRDMEREAYTKGNLIFRDFEDLIKTGKINIEIDFSDSGEPKMSLKEWKNNEINTKLMKKWGLLKEAAKPDFLDLDKDGDKEEPMKDAAKDAKEMNEDSEGEETYHYGEDEGEDAKELHDLIKRHATRSHIDALKRDMEYDEDHEDRHERGTHFREGTEDIEEGHCQPMRDEDEDDLDEAEGRGKDYEGIGSKESDNMRGNRYGMKKKLATKGAPEFTGAKVPSRGSRSRGRLGGTYRAITQETKISVTEAKEITQRIIERIKQETK